MSDKKTKAVSFPSKLLKPIAHFLEEELTRLRKTKKSIEKDDPFKDEERDEDNSLESDVDEQLGHFHTEVKASFLNKQMVSVRRALSRIRRGKYGVCEVCHKMIDTDRLAIKPDATVCVKCEKDKE